MPVSLVISDDDKVVPPGLVLEWGAHLQKSGHKVRYRHFPGLGHSFPAEFLNASVEEALSYV